MVAASHSGTESKFETVNSGGNFLRPPMPSWTVAIVSIYRHSSTTTCKAGGSNILGAALAAGKKRQSHILASMLNLQSHPDWARIKMR
jgi:hypothetical protein